MPDDRLTHLLQLQETLGGSIPFDRWMAEALYHPLFGYYTSNIRTVGRRGDFSTWATLHDSLGVAIVGWLRENKVGRGSAIIEVGGGTGEVALSILRKFSFWARPKYHIVEISPILRENQKGLLRGLPVTWHDTMREALAICNGEAAIFSNELVDAFPCRIFQKEENEWKELSLKIGDGKIAEMWSKAILPKSTIFGADWPVGQRVEVHESYLTWIAEWLPDWKVGTMLTIDYGDRSSAIYHRRPRGSLRAYAHHQRLDGIEAYAGFGKRDLTADVNFSDMEQWGRDLGLYFKSLMNMGDFFFAV